MLLSRGHTYLLYIHFIQYISASYLLCPSDSRLRKVVQMPFSLATSPQLLLGNPKAFSDQMRYTG